MFVEILVWVKMRTHTFYLNVINNISNRASQMENLPTSSCLQSVSFSPILLKPVRIFQKQQFQSPNFPRKKISLNKHFHSHNFPAYSFDCNVPF